MNGRGPRRGEGRRALKRSCRTRRRPRSTVNFVPQRRLFCPTAARRRDATAHVTPKKPRKNCTARSTRIDPMWNRFSLAAARSSRSDSATLLRGHSAKAFSTALIWRWLDRGDSLTGSLPLHPFTQSLRPEPLGGIRIGHDHLGMQLWPSRSNPHRPREHRHSRPMHTGERIALRNSVDRWYGAIGSRRDERNRHKDSTHKPGRTYATCF
jgi:hypothetical protein